jgi:hypothetical protein
VLALELGLVPNFDVVALIGIRHDEEWVVDATLASVPGRFSIDTVRCLAFGMAYLPFEGTAVCAFDVLVGQKAAHVSGESD